MFKNSIGGGAEVRGGYPWVPHAPCCINPDVPNLILLEVSCLIPPLMLKSCLIPPLMLRYCLIRPLAEASVSTTNAEVLLDSPLMLKYNVLLDFTSDAEVLLDSTTNAEVLLDSTSNAEVLLDSTTV